MIDVDCCCSGIDSKSSSSSRPVSTGLQQRRRRRRCDHKERVSVGWMAALTTAVVQLVLVRYYSSQVAGVEGFLVTQSSMTSVLALRQYMPSYGKASQQRKATTLWLAKSGTKKKKAPDRTVAVNRIAYRNYEIIDTMEAGISLLGTEVKSIRDGKLNLRDGYVRPSKNGRSCVLYNVHVGKCSQVGAEYFQHEEKRPRTLLVHSSQARKFLQQTEQQGMTVIPLKAYWNDGNKLKIEIALCRGKNVRDKRATIQERDAKRETSRIIKNFRI